MVVFKLPFSGRTGTQPKCCGYHCFFFVNGTSAEVTQPKCCVYLCPFFVNGRPAKSGLQLW